MVNPPYASAQMRPDTSITMARISSNQFGDQINTYQNRIVMGCYSHLPHIEMSDVAAHYPTATIEDKRNART